MSSSNVQLAIAGHAGIGHSHCPGGLIQDDSLGFAVAGAMLKDVLCADTRVRSVEADADSNIIRITTADGGIGEASPRRGITPAEAELMQRVVGGDALLCQAVAVRALGRMYGQGILETPSALQAALANSVIDTFHRVAPDRILATSEDIPTNSGLIAGMIADVDGISVAVMAVVNASSGGIGPNEDLEGNVPLGSKRTLMERLGMLKCPTIVLEGKAYTPALSGSIDQTMFLVRVQRDLDNIVVADALHESAMELGYPVVFKDDAFLRDEGALRRRTVEVAERIAEAAEELKRAERGTDKVRVAAELARLVSQEVGGVSFMTDRLYDVVRTTGLIPGTSAVLSMLVTRGFLEHWKIPLVQEEDIEAMIRIVRDAVPRIAARLDEANEVLARLYEDPGPLEPLIR